MKIVKKTGEELVLMLSKKIDDYILLPNEDDVTSVEILEGARPWELNYAEKKDCYQYLGKTFSNQSDETKDRIVQCCGISDSECIAYYVSKGMSQADALSSYIQSRCDGITQLISVCDNNIKDSKLITILLSYMSQEQAERFLDATFQLVYNYANFAVYGKKYGNYIDGILDYIEDHGVYAGNGLSTYTLYPGKNLSSLVSALVTLLTNNRSNIV